MSKNLKNCFEIVAIDMQNRLQNYIWLLKDTQNKSLVVIDPTQADIVQEYCQTHDYRIEQIWITHKHDDHIAGVAELKTFSNATVYAPLAEKDDIQLADIWLDDGEQFTWHELKVDCFSTIGHTLGHMCFYLPQLDSLFSGDTLFVMGCGRVFEGSLQQMYESLQKIKLLPSQTMIYCTHEYTLSNAEFATTMYPDNPDIQQRYQHIKVQREHKQPTVPTTLAAELKTNVFLTAKDLAEFSHLRTQKDLF
ncbi:MULTISPECIES: hydroxyacylglutathione hydrolase [unclassified Acinetobacter]|uniref:hydroxyacylglutathione hydrolase n=1 Tax=unclassified Acinetobacter TaxID=196816 RepID=UPI0035B8B668